MEHQQPSVLVTRGRLVWRVLGTTTPREKRSRSIPLATIIQMSRRSELELKGYNMERAISGYSAGVPYAPRFTAAVKIPLPLATFQF